jgi:hypothetical protein
MHGIPCGKHLVVIIRMVASVVVRKMTMLFHSICLSVMTLILFILLILQVAKVHRLEKRIKRLEQDKGE